MCYQKLKPQPLLIVKAKMLVRILFFFDGHVFLLFFFWYTFIYFLNSWFNGRIINNVELESRVQNPISNKSGIY